MSIYTRPATIAATLVTAARYIDLYGWYRGYLYDAHDGCTRRCEAHRTGRYPASILGAIRAALLGQAKWYLSSTPPGTVQAYAAALDHFNHYLTTVGAAGMRAPVLVWQATPDRTPIQVVAALRAAASTAPPTRFETFEPARPAPVIDLAERRPAPSPATLFGLPTQPAA